LFLNKGGKFDDKADHEIPLPQLAEPSKVRVLPAGKGKAADLFVGGKSAALLVADGKFPKYKEVRLDVGDANRVRVLDEGKRKTTVIARRFGGLEAVDDLLGKPKLSRFLPGADGAYLDVRSVDLNNDGRPDLVTSYGHVYLRGADGKLPAEPTMRLPVEKGEWYSLAVGDFNGDGRPDVVLLSYGMHGQTAAHVFYNRNDTDKPFPDEPHEIIPLNPAKKGDPFTLLRDAPVVYDWDGDGIDDLVIGRGQSQEVLILLGGLGGLDPQRTETIHLDYRVHYETGLYVGDFDGDGRPDLAAFGYTLTGVGWNGPPAAYIWLQPRREKADKDAPRDKKDKGGPPKKPEAEFTNKVGMKFVWIEPGSFLMGSPDGKTPTGVAAEEKRNDDETPHKVTLTKGYYLAATLVTQEQWEKVMGKDANHSHFKGEDDDEKKKLPLDNVSWDDCQEFCKKLSALDGRRYTLPTEAEWEYACRAGTTTPFWFGKTISADQANYDSNFAYGKDGKQTEKLRKEPTPVKQFPANPWKLHDMHGNLSQWCEDWYNPYPDKDVTDPVSLTKGEENARILRGGSWFDYPQRCRAAYRRRVDPALPRDNCGCRVVCRPD
jgi:formylglycine-generating enzyme required for sulfatase activity